MMRLKSDLVEVLLAGVRGELATADLHWDPRSAICVVCAADGYPHAARKGDVIQGLAEANSVTDTVVFHAGTVAEDGDCVVSGGRVLGVTSLGGTLADAASRAYQAVDKISWPGMQVRRDIAWRAL